MDLTRQRLLITGGKGFLGSHITDHLVAAGCEPIADDRQAEHGIWTPGSAAYDLTIPGVADSLCAHVKPHTIIHLAALTGGIGANRQRPADFFYQNLMMGTQLLEAARRYRVPKFVGVGSVCSYPKLAPVPFHESDLWNGYPEETNAPYGIAKKMLLVQGQAYREQYGYNAIHLLPVNLYGPRDNFNLDSAHVIPALIRKILYARDHEVDTVEVWGTGKATREFLYVNDAAEAIVLATQKYDSAEPLNIGSGQEISIADLVTLLADIVEYKGKVFWNIHKPDGQPRRSLDTTRATRELGFQARTPLRDGLIATVQWFEQNIHPVLLGRRRDDSVRI